MATLKHADSRKNMYSWWWNSHISPKNSKWLQENLTDMDVKVKSMIKLIEEDADSFARRAEMYYKKRPELMKLVEEFYRAYRALAERYDHATGALRQAHRTMAEAFPNQIPLNPDDSPAGSEADPRTTEMSTPARGMFEHEDMQKDAPFGAKRNRALGEESEGSVRKVLNFGGAEEDQALSDPERGGKMEKEILSLKEALAKLEAEKEAALVQYERSLESLYKLKVEFAHAQKDSKELTERASRAEAEAQTLKEDRSRLEAEKKDTLVYYQECLEKVTTLEKDLSQAQEDTRRLNKQSAEAENEAQLLKQDLTKLEAEKDAALDQYQQSLEKISVLEKKLTNAEEDARKFSECAEKAEGELETLKQAIAKLIEEKEAEAVLYQQCLETIASLEHKLLLAQEEAERLSGEIDSGVAKLKGVEEQCVMLEKSNQSLHAELESLVAKMDSQSNELTEKQKELGRLWTSIQEERMRFVEAETAFQTLQHLHSQAQEELRSLASELQNRDQILTDMEMRNQSLQDEILKYKEENKNLSELNLSSTMLTKDMRDEIFILKESNGKLEEEVGLRVDQRNALQQEIYCLKEELNELNRKHRLILEQVDTVGLHPERFGSYVKELQDENSNLKEVCQRERSERLALLEKLEIMGQLLEKNAVLENSLSDLGAELEGVRGKIRVLEDSCRSLLEEKSTLADEKASLIDQLQVTTDNLGKLSEKNSIMENSLSDLGATLEAVRVTIRVLEDSCRSLLAEKSTLADEKASLVDRLQVTTENLEQLSEKNSVLQNLLSDAHVEIEVLKSKSKNLEDSCQLHVVEKSALVAEKGSLASEIEISQKSLKDLEIRYAELKEKCLSMERERASTLHKIEALEESLAVQKQEHACAAQMNGMQLAGMEGQIRQLKEEARDRTKELEEELDNGFTSQFEIFVLGRSIQELEENNFSLVNDFQKLLEASKSSEKLIGVLEQEKTENRVIIESLTDHITALRVQMHQLLKVFNIELDHECEDMNGLDQMCLDRIFSRAEDTKHALFETEEESKQLVVEMSIIVTLLRQLRSELTNLEIEKNSIEKELTTRTEKFLELQSEAHKVREVNEALRLQVTEGEHQEKVLLTQIENLRGEVLEVRGAYESEKNSIEQELTTRTEKFLEMEGEAKKIREMNEELRLKVNEGERKEEILETRIKNICGELFEVHGAYGELLAENLQVSEERKTLMKELSNAADRVHTVEGENNIFIDELYHQSILSLILKNYLDEKSAEICGLVEVIGNHNGINDALLQKIRTMERELEGQQMENRDLKETLQKSKHELETVIFVRDELSCEILSGKNLLGLKERELMEAEEKLKSLENEKMELYKTFEDLKKEGDEVKMASAEQGKRILDLSDITNRLSEEQICLREARRILELELQQLRKEHEKTISELHREREEFEALESHAVEDYGDLLTSAICQALLGMKVRELADAFVSLQEENISKDMNAEVLKEGIRSMEGENESLKSQVSSYASALVSLRDCIVSVENLSCLQAQLQKSNEDVKGAELVNHQSGKGADEFSDLWDLQSRVKAIENSVVELERLRVQENINANTKLEAVMRQMEELELQRSYHKGERKPTSEILEVGTKDIVLDQESESSSHERSKKVGENQMLELWETTYQDSSIDLTVGKSKRQLKPKAEDVVAVEKELGVDKLDISKRFKEPREEGNKRKVLERLNSDDQRLTNLHITVQDLKKKVETTEKNQTGKAAVECDTLKGQLEEAEEAILKLFDLTAKLMKNIDESSHTPDKNAANESEESKAARRKRVSEQARRISEKIGRLQLEVQKIQFVLLKLDDEQENKGRSRFLDAKRRVLLKDYLYGGGRTKATIHRKTKAPFCACMEPTTRE